VSEWLTFQALLQNVRMPRPELNLVFTLGLAGLALTAGLAVACFVKAFGITFLAMPRTEVAARAHEAPVSMRAAMVVLVAACGVLGLAATLVLPAIAAVAGSLLDAREPVATGDWLTVQVVGDFAGVSPLAVGVALVLAVAATFALLVVAGASRRRRLYETWGCGRMLQTARMEYTATAFASPFTRVFDFFYRPVKRLDIEFHPESRFFVRKIQYENPTRSIVDEWLYRPVLATLRAGVRGARLMQSGSANLYLIYILAALLLMLVFA
jgi:hydrogenase-4 component B